MIQTSIALPHIIISVIVLALTLWHKLTRTHTQTDRDTQHFCFQPWHSRCHRSGKKVAKWGQGICGSIDVCIFLSRSRTLSPQSFRSRVQILTVDLLICPLIVRNLIIGTQLDQVLLLLPNYSFFLHPRTNEVSEREREQVRESAEERWERKQHDVNMRTLNKQFENKRNNETNWKCESSRIVHCLVGVSVSVSVSKCICISAYLTWQQVEWHWKSGGPNPEPTPSQSHF